MVQCMFTAFTVGAMSTFWFNPDRDRMMMLVDPTSDCLVTCVIVNVIGLDLQITFTKHLFVQSRRFELCA